MTRTMLLYRVPDDAGLLAAVLGCIEGEPAIPLATRAVCDDLWQRRGHPARIAAQLRHNSNRLAMEMAS